MARMLVVGASGSVGRELLRLLAEDDLEVLPSSRQPSQPGWRRLDICDAASVRTAMQGVDVVVNCAGPFTGTPLTLAEACIERGARYLDISASMEHFLRMLQLDARARGSGATLVTAFGAVPGMAGVLLAHEAARMDQVDDAAIYAAAGGGLPAISRGSLLDMLNDRAKEPLVWRGQWEKAGSIKTDFRLPRAQRLRCFPVRSPDIFFPPQNTRQQAAWFGVGGLCLPLLLVAGQLLGAGSSAWKQRWLLGLIRASAALRWGLPGFHLKLELRGRVAGEARRYRLETYTELEALSTALPLAVGCRHLLQGDCPAGVFTPAQVIPAEPLLQAFREQGFELVEERG